MNQTVNEIMMEKIETNLEKGFNLRMYLDQNPNDQEAQKELDKLWNEYEKLTSNLK